ncbi:hypothetical protein ACFO1B_55470 [Dactylosporangium siamense]|uniref:Uncharacterized protein n=1 Tax=Dactylosporangium siamense TaxID=685454 RepID=A0A919PZB7_9ACTN|nr:hypothetical protein [Dactylosporangium siamense]GIG53131.1 hypothetical protein Dsi01nite_111720 [Dactylosporangium siamense]
MGRIELAPYLAGLLGGGGLLGVVGKWLVEREKTKREQIRRNAEITLRAIELTFPHPEEVEQSVSQRRRRPSVEGSDSPRAA